MPGYTFANLPVHALITDLKKFDPKKVILVKTHHLAMLPTSLSRPKYFGTSPKLPVHALIHDPLKKNLRASTRTHDPISDNPEIWPTFIYRGEVPGYTFAKLPVHALITDLKKFDPKKVISVKTHHLAMLPTSLSRPKYFGTSPKLPVHALIHDP